VTNEEFGIRDLSKVARGEWIPPIGAMGGPPAHELYRDLVIHAGLRLSRDSDGVPWVELRDGEHRRAFPVPSPELTAALDRFRMRRNLRPVPEEDIVEFSRVVEARISDPDVAIPLRESDEGVPAEGLAPWSEGDSPHLPEVEEKESWAVDELDRTMREVDSIQGRTPDAISPPREPASWSRDSHSAPLHSRLPHRWHASVSGGRRATTEDRLPRYIRVLRELVQGGSWIGSLGEIARRTGDDTDQVFATLLRFHSDLIGKDLVVAPVEVEEGWQWLVVDRSRIRPPADHHAAID
jgi:hypothetical protein